jgi:hypothetical protein
LVIKILFWSPFVMGATWMSTNNFLHSSWYMQRTCQNRHRCDAWCKVATSHQFWQPEVKWSCKFIKFGSIPLCITSDNQLFFKKMYGFQ